MDEMLLYIDIFLRNKLGVVLGLAGLLLRKPRPSLTFYLKICQYMVNF